jgi:hypothetical protein
LSPKTLIYAHEPLENQGFRPVNGYFLLQPNPWQSACQLNNASTGHTGGIMAGLGDGSVRMCAQGLSPTTWWMAMVPEDGLPMASDW